jgi:Polysaccharide lyase
MRKRPHVRYGRAAIVVAAGTLAVAIAVLASAAGEVSAVKPSRFVTKTRVVMVRGRDVLLVESFAVVGIDRGASARVACAHCQRLAGRLRLTHTPTSRSLAGTNWLLAGNRVITVSVTERGSIGRFYALGASATQRLVLRRSGCLSAAGRHVICPGGAATGTGTRQTITGASTTITPTLTTPAAPGAITSAATLDGDVSPLHPQCAPATPSKSPRLRGTFVLENSIVGQGTGALEITLPVDTDLTTFPLEACGLITSATPIGLGTDAYYGLMIYVPQGWTIPNSAFYGVNVYELHFQNVYGAPITLQVHPDHVTLALETGGCDNHATAHPGCTWRSNADAPQGSRPTLRGYYAIPPGRFVQGAWNEVIVHVHWSDTASGMVQTYYRVKGARRWLPSSSISGIPTVQWDNALGCCAPTYDDQLEAYTAGVSAPLSIWLDNAVTGTSLAVVEATMP